MANTYTQIHLQIVTCVKFRQAMIDPKWKSDLHAYITGIVQGNKHKMLIINSMPDHLHMLIGFRPHQALSDLMKVVNGDSSEWINLHGLSPGKFNWQPGYGAFSYTKDLI
ncbi:MAG TPA: transposase, partial [Saprospiraceae bacterium]|nr:transposase [Saprospiraceae bacterium]